MENPKIPDRNSPVVRKTALFLRSEFSDMSVGVATLQAQLLVSSLEWRNHLFHNGAIDRKALVRLIKNLEKAKAALADVSLWIETGLETALHRSYLTQGDEFEDGDNPVPPMTKGQLNMVLDVWIAAAKDAEEMRKGWRTENGKNAKAIALIDEARKLWKSTTGENAPPKSLGTETKFCEFLTELFDVVGVGGDAPSAYDAWADIAYARESPLVTPRK